MHPVGEVHVEVAGRSEHDAIARRLPPERMAAGILVAGVGLDLDEPDGKPPGLRIVGDEQFVEQIGREVTRVAREERPRKSPSAPPRGGHVPSSQARCSSSRARAAAS